MYKQKNVVIIIALILIINIACILPTRAFSNLPQNIRVGLKFGSTSISSLITSSHSGGKIGFVKNNVFSPLVNFPASTIINIRNDSSYHLKIGGNFVSYAAAMEEISRLKSMADGYLAVELYPMLSESWSVCTGYYLTLPVKGQVTPQNPTDEYGYLDDMFGVGITAPIKSGDNAVTIATTTGTMMVFDGTTNNARLRMIPDVPSSGPALMKLGQAQYRGVLDLYRQNGDDMVVVNELNFEEYLYSVLPAEMPPGLAPQRTERIEPLKVQAYSARTFAYNQINESRFTSFGFDVDDSTNTQVYGGYKKVNGAQGEYPNSNEAVDLTKGQLLLFNGAPATSIFYHSNNAGFTEVIENVWTGTRPQYMDTRPDPYSAVSNKRWTASYTGKQLNTTFGDYVRKSKGVDVGKIEYVTIMKRATSGRVIEMLIEGNKNDYLLTRESCRTVLTLSSSSQWFNFKTLDIINVLYKNGSDTTPSFTDRARKALEGGYFTRKFLSDSYSVVGSNGMSYERVKIIPNDTQKIVIDGKGTGHALGLSQDGAMEMGRQGKDAKFIIDFYFPGVVIG